MVLALASCALSPAVAHPVPASLRRYEEVASFLLPGFQSLALCTLPPDEDSTAGGRVALLARCGSDFQAPRHVGYGAYRGVEVIDFGPSGIGAETPRGDLVNVGGVPVWQLCSTDEPRTEHSVDTWVAHVDRRFVVITHHRELLEMALQRSGRLDQLLQPFASLPALPADAESVVCLLPRPSDHSYWGRPVPIERMRAALSPEHRLQLWHRQPLPEQFTAWSAYAKGPPATTSEHGWQVTTIDLQPDPTMRSLLLDLLSGLAIFI